MGYGWQFWRCMPDGVYRGDGASGQYIIVLTKQDAVIATTAGSPDMQAMLDIFWENMLPCLDNSAKSGEVPETLYIDDSHEALSGGCKMPEKYIGRYYQLKHNPMNIFGFKFDAPDRLTFTIADDRREYGFRIGNGEWINTSTGYEEGRAFPFHPTLFGEVSASGKWTDENTFEMYLIGSRLSYQHTWKFTFVCDRVTVDFKQNLAGPQMTFTGCAVKKQK